MWNTEICTAVFWNFHYHSTCFVYIYLLLNDCTFYIHSHVEQCTMCAWFFITVNIIPSSIYCIHVPHKSQNHCMFIVHNHVKSLICRQLLWKISNIIHPWHTLVPYKSQNLFMFNVHECIKHCIIYNCFLELLISFHPWHFKNFVFNINHKIR